MCTTHPSSLSSSMDDKLQEIIDNNDDSISLENGSEKEELYFQDFDSDSHDNIIEKTKDGHFGKVYNFLIYNFYIV